MEKFHRLRSGALIPTLGLGTYKPKGDDCYNAVLSAVLDNGYRHIDTASMYQNEIDVGRAIKIILESGIKREELFITTKLWCNDYEPDKISEKFHESLNALGLDYIDLFLMHFPFSIKNGNDYPNGDYELSYIPTSVVWAELEKLVDQGLIIDIGICNFPVAMILENFSYARIKPSAIQVELHPYNTQQKLLKFCKKLEIQIIGFGSLGGVNYKHVHPVIPLLEHEVIIEISQKYETTPACILLN